ncbi:MAG: hypothetical protein WC492_05040 [Candidatus Micrarchaeia archaeon]
MNVKGQIPREKEIFGKKNGTSQEITLAKTLALTENNASIRAIMDAVAAKYELNSPYEIFEQDRTAKVKLLAEYIRDARKAGYNDVEIYFELNRAEYPSKIKNYKSMNVDQACAQEILGSDEVDWTTLLGGDKDIIEGKKSLGGTFGKIATPKEYREIQCANNPAISCNENSGLEVSNEIADALYLLEHAQHANLPQAPYIMFGECAKGENGDFQAAKNRATSHRASFKKHLAGIVGNIDRDNHLKISNTAHGGTTKYRMLCVVFCEKTGRLMVVSESNNLDGSAKKPVRFADWAKTTDENGSLIKLNNLLSTNDAELHEIIGIASKPGGLLEKIREPQNDENYHPWKDLEEYTKKEMRKKNADGSEDGWYKRACKIWRYAIMIDRIENTLWYEKNWKDIKLIREIKDNARECVCDDSRQKGDVKVLAGFLTKKEFVNLVKELVEKRDEKATSKIAKIDEELAQAILEYIIFRPHYGCGFMTGSHYVHNMFEMLGNVLKDAYKDEADSTYSEYKRSMQFFGNLMRQVSSGSGPVTQLNVLKDYIPKEYVNELDAYLKDRANGVINHHPNEKRELVQFLFEVFVDNREKMRAVIRRGTQETIGVLAQNSNTELIYMPAAKNVYSKLHEHYGDKYATLFSKSQINNLIIEEAVRIMLSKYEQWIIEEGFDGKIKLLAHMENFYTGQLTIIPPEKTTLGEFKNMTRKDFYLTNEDMFSKQEMYDLGLEDKMMWEIPA